MRTLVQLAIMWSESVDRVRKIVRETPELRALGTRVGSTKGYTEVEAEAIKAALERRELAAK